MGTKDSLFNRYTKELKQLIYLSGPIFGAMLATTGMGFVDTSMAGQYSAEDLAAVAMGTSIWVPVYLLMRGILIAATPMVAHMYGAGKTNDIGPLMRQTFWVALGLSFISILLLKNAATPLHWLDVPEPLIALVVSYLDALSWGIPAILLYQAFVSYCEGRSKTKPAMLVSFAALLLNIPLNYILIYGHFGFPELGGVGCGYATAICFWLMLLLMFLYTRFSSDNKASNLYEQWDWPDYQVTLKVLKLGVPMGLGIFCEASVFSVIALLLGKLGANVVAGHQVALNFSSLMFMLPLSLSIGVTIRVGQVLGAEKPKEAAFVSYSSIITSLIIACFTASMMWFFSDWIVSIYTDDPEVTTLAAQLLLYAAIFQFADGVQIASNGALRGYQDTRVPMIMVIIACWLVALPLGYVLGMTHVITEPMGPQGLWVGLIAALTLCAIQLAARLWLISQREIRKGYDGVSASYQ